MIIKRFLYLAYYLKEMDWRKLNQFLFYSSQKAKRSRLSLLLSSMSDSIRYNIGIIDYFIFRFYQKEHEEKKQWAGTGFKYEYDLMMNPKKTRKILENKIKFYKEYSPFIIHSVCSVEDIKENNEKAKSVLNNTKNKIVLKDALGQCGWNIEIINPDEFSQRELILHMKKRGFNLAEEYILQHPNLAKLSDTGLNTIRVVTQLNKNNEVDILGARLRISVNNYVDNLASGNIAAPIDTSNGVVSGPAYYSDITKEKVEYHPVTKEKIIGFQIPYWKDIIKLTKQAALHRPENRSVGWDIALTERGPGLIEGNHNWCKILWQVPVNKGLKHILEKYLYE